MIKGHTKKQKKEYIFVISYDKAFYDMQKEYEDAQVESSIGDPIGFVLPKSSCNEILDNYPSDDITIYDISTIYNNISDFEEDYKSGEYSMEDMNNDNIQIKSKI